MCSSLHVKKHKTTRVCLVVYVCLFEQETANTVAFVPGYILCSSLSVKFMLFKFISLSFSCLCLSCSLLCSQSMKAFTGWKSSAVSQRVGVYGLGQGFLVLQDPNSALRDSYSTPTPHSIKLWTTSTFLD